MRNTPDKRFLLAFVNSVICNEHIDLSDVVQK